MVFNHAEIAPPINAIESNGLNDESVPQVQVFPPSLVNTKQAWQPDYNDNFFHITCDIDPSLRSKIEKGEFIELDKLLPKDKYATKSEDQRVELVNRDGSTFFVAAGKYNKINSIHKWEHAFRIYAAIYSKANPHRAAEIWQYVDVIHLAAAAYSWENVSMYDNTFCRLMSQYPATDVAFSNERPNHSKVEDRRKWW